MRSSLSNFFLKHHHKQSLPMQRKANQYHVPVVKNSEVEQSKLTFTLPLSLGRIYIPSEHHTPFYMFAIVKHPFNCVCVRKPFSHMSASARHPFTRASSKTSFYITAFPKKQEVSTSHCHVSSDFMCVLCSTSCPLTFMVYLFQQSAHSRA